LGVDGEAVGSDDGTIDGRKHGSFQRNIEQSGRDGGLPEEPERAEVQVESLPVEGVTVEAGDPEEGEGWNTPSRWWYCRIVAHQVDDGQGCWEATVARDRNILWRVQHGRQLEVTEAEEPLVGRMVR
jgi:hypothetical protein